MTAELDQIKAALREHIRLSDEATVKWMPRHPCGGQEIYANAQTYEPLASFAREKDCAFAIHARTFAPAAAKRELALIEWLERVSLWNSHNFAPINQYAETLRFIVSQWPKGAR